MPTEEKIKEILGLSGIRLNIKVSNSLSFGVLFVGDYSFMDRRGYWYEGTAESTTYETLIQSIHTDLINQNALWGSKLI